MEIYVSIGCCLIQLKDLLHTVPFLFVVQKKKDVVCISHENDLKDHE